MKKIIPYLFLMMIFLCGCDGQLESAHLVEGTQGLSTNYVVRVTLDNDKRLEEKFVDLEIMSSKEILLSFGAEGEEQKDLEIATKDEWYKLVELEAVAGGKENFEVFKKYEDFGNASYIFTVPEDCCLTFRVVAGNSVPNQAETGYLLTSTTPISKELKIKAKAA